MNFNIDSFIRDIHRFNNPDPQSSASTEQLKERASRAIAEITVLLTSPKSTADRNPNKLRELKAEVEQYSSTSAKVEAASSSVIGGGRTTSRLLQYIDGAIKKDWNAQIQEKIWELANIKNERQIRRAVKWFLLQTFSSSIGPFSYTLAERLEDIEVDRLEFPSVGFAKVFEETIRDPHLFTAYEIKRGVIREEPSESIIRLLERLPSGQVISPQRAFDGEKNSKFETLQKERLFRLHHLKDVYSYVIRDPSQQVKSKFFPKTEALYVGSTGFERELRLCLNKHGIKTVFDAHAYRHNDYPDLTVKFAYEKDVYFPQDCLDFSQSEIRVPAMDAGFASRLERVMKRSRTNRGSSLWEYQGLPNAVTVSKPPYETISFVGKVLRYNESEAGIALASALRAECMINLTYSEGGNTLIGNFKNGEPYIIVGKDSYALSKALMEKDLKRDMSHEEVLLAFGIDYGIRMENIFFVEQPGDFHLDMNMAIVGEKTVVVNDSVQAALEIKLEMDSWLRNKIGIKDPEQRLQARKELMNAALLRKRFEDKTVEDLVNQGFEVIRLPGKFYFQGPTGPEVPVMNFFNMVTATTPNNKRIVIALGLLKGFENLFKNMLSKGNMRVDEVILLDYEVSKDNLMNFAGISCVVKTIIGR